MDSSITKSYYRHFKKIYKRVKKHKNIWQRIKDVINYE